MNLHLLNYQIRSAARTCPTLKQLNTMHKRVATGRGPNPNVEINENKCKCKLK